MNLPIHPFTLQWTAQKISPTHDCPSTGHWSTNGLSRLSIDGFRDLKLVDHIPSLSTKWIPLPKGRRPSHWPSIDIRRWDCFGQFCPPTWVLLQGPLVGPWDFFPIITNQKHDCIWFEDLSHEFYPRQTRKTQRNMPRQIRSFQGTSLERHGRYWTFDLQSSWNSTHYLYKS